MCEIFGISSYKKIRVNELLKEFFSHSSEHRNGWGLAGFDDGYPAVEKEPVTANESSYLKARLEDEIRTSRLVAHIRRATCGVQDHDNTHPFVKRDVTGRIWTLVHNGHVFEAPALRSFLDIQKGSTDSERILLYIAKQVGKAAEGGPYEEDERGFDREQAGPADDSARDRFRLIERIVLELAPCNKINFILYDGEYMYVHSNEPGGLHVKTFRAQDQGTDWNHDLSYTHPGCTRIFSTSPLSDKGWEKLPENRLHVYKDGEEVYTGAPHKYTFIWDPVKEQTLYMSYSGL